MAAGIVELSASAQGWVLPPAAFGQPQPFLSKMAVHHQQPSIGIAVNHFADLLKDEVPVPLVGDGSLQAAGVPGLDHLTAFGHRVAKGLLHQNISSCSKGIDRLRHMKRMGRADEDRVWPDCGQHLFVIAKGWNELQTGIALFCSGDLFRAGVGQSNNLSPINSKNMRDMGSGHSATADQAESDLFHNGPSYTAILVGWPALHWGRTSITMKLFSTALVFFAAAMALPFDGEERLLPKVTKDLATARQAAASGDWAKAEALVQLVRNPQILVEAPDDATPVQLQALEEATAIWEHAMGGAIDFQIVAQGSGQVRVKFEKDVYFSGYAAMGRATWSRQLIEYGWGSYGSQVSASIQIRTQLNGKECRLEQLRHALAHELGHVLGLDDSPRLGDIMGPQVDGPSPVEPSEEELSALSELHWEAFQVELMARSAAPRN